jgi:hypothetical protein
VAGLGALLIWQWRSRTTDAVKAASLCVATILAAPFAFDYDMLILAPAIALFVADGAGHGFAPGVQNRARRSLSHANHRPHI